VIGQYSDLTLFEIIKNLKNYFGFDQVKVITNDLKTKINNVLLSSGAGGSVIEAMPNNQNIDLFITGEMK